MLLKRRLFNTLDHNGNSHSLEQEEEAVFALLESLLKTQAELIVKLEARIEGLEN